MENFTWILISNSERCLNLNQWDLAKDFLNQSKIRLETANRVIDQGMYAYSIRQSQEAVELALKGAMRLLGIDFPKWHDISPILIELSDEFPEHFRNEIHNLSEISEKLVSLREPAMYGDENLGLGPSALFSRSDSMEILKDAEYCYEKIENLFKFFENKNKK
ncbi:MAG: HEPN domain-containing protein [Promethearchaeota archaeon]|nr:MAG: HEPN domain-containing protein [Candidatus Lokiarchaeota archaeon]